MSSILKDLKIGQTITYKYSGGTKGPRRFCKISFIDENGGRVHGTDVETDEPRTFLFDRMSDVEVIAQTNEVVVFPANILKVDKGLIPATVLCDLAKATVPRATEAVYDLRFDMVVVTFKGENSIALSSDGNHRKLTFTNEAGECVSVGFTSDATNSWTVKLHQKDVIGLLGKLNDMFQPPLSIEQMMRDRLYGGKS
jgi:hypothetical protein